MTSLSLVCSYYFGRCSSELAQLVPLRFSRGRPTHYSDRLHDFSVTIPRCYKDVYVNSFFPRTAKLWNSLPIECFSLTYDLSGFKSRINRHFFNCCFFLSRFPICCNLFILLFLVTPYLVVAVQPYMEWITIKKKSFHYVCNLSFTQRYSTADLKICQYCRLQMKICGRFHIKTYFTCTFKFFFKTSEHKLVFLHD